MEILFTTKMEHFNIENDSMKPRTLRYHRRSTRLKGYDYSSPGFYFITICTKNRQCIFGEVCKEKMVLNEAGNFTSDCWNAIPNHYPNVKLHAFQIMPNHLHGILEIVNQSSNQEIQNSSIHDFSIHQVGVQNFEPLPDELKNKNKIKSNSIFNSLECKQNKYQHIIPKSLGSIVRGFEIGVTKWFRANTQVNVVWQRNFYDSILRTEKSIRIVSKYIANNPKNWKKDEYYNDK